MNKNWWILLVILVFSGLLSGQEYNIATYNIRFDNPGDKPHIWSARLPLITDQMNRFQPDIVGFQEVLHHQLMDLHKAMPGYKLEGIGRDDGKKSGEYSPVFYNSARFELQESGTFWLSDNPDRPSVGWDAALPRIATWVLLRDNVSDDVILVLNTHFDHVGQRARLESAKKIASFINQNRFDGARKMVVGDMNTSPTDAPYLFLNEETSLKDSYLEAAQRVGPIGTFNAFQYNMEGARIDYIWLDPAFSVIEYSVIQEEVDGVIPSDHWPVFVKVKW